MSRELQSASDRPCWDRQILLGDRLIPVCPSREDIAVTGRICQNDRVIVRIAVRISRRIGAAIQHVGNGVGIRPINGSHGYILGNIGDILRHAPYTGTARRRPRHFRKAVAARVPPF